LVVSHVYDSSRKLSVSTAQQTFALYNLWAKITFPEEQTFINKDTVTIEGIVESSKRTRRTGLIGSVEYSLDREKSWLPARAKDGSFNESIEDFTFYLDNLKEGTHQVVIRGNDASGIIAKATKTIVVDFTRPVPPSVLTPQTGVVVGDVDDLDIDSAGVQIPLSGKTEKENTILITNSQATFEGISDSSGNFDIEVTLRKHGENVLNVVTIDPAGNRSKQETISIVYNNPPDIKLLWPREGGGLNHVAEVVYEIQDKDLDPVIASSLSYRKSGEVATHLIVENLEENTFSWDVSELPEGEYKLIIKATDGVSKNTLTRKFIVDNTKPTIVSKPLEKKILNEAIKLKANSTAEDNLSGIEYVEYSIDGENWYKALITEGHRTKTADSRFTYPYLLPDGKHPVSFRATDVAGNVSDATSPQEVIIDTSPPRVGNYTISSGPFILLPEGETFKIPENITTAFVLSLEKDTEEAVLTIGESEFPLKKLTGLWRTDISPLPIGVYSLVIWAKDVFGNTRQKREIGRIAVVPKGRIIFESDGKQQPLEDAAMTISVFNKENQSWVQWQAGAHRLSNPVFTNKNGEYTILLPAGTYQIVVQKIGFQRLKSSSFTIRRPHFITSDFRLEPRVGFRGFFEDLIERITF